MAGEALVWAKHHLDPKKDYVETAYNSPGSYLPAVAQIGCNGWHCHHFLARQVQAANAHRPCTHRFMENGAAKDAKMQGDVIFQNRGVTIIRISAATDMGIR